MRKLIIIYTAIFCINLISCKSNNYDGADSDKKNVLFIMTDDLNCDLGSYNHDQVISPNIDKLAEEGFLFENAHVQWPQCGQSRASFMTGMYSDQTKHTKLNVDIRTTIPDVITLGQRFRQRGYKSVRIGKIYHYDNPGSIGTSSADDIYTWDYTINPYGRDKEEEYKIKTLKTRQYGGTLSWLEAEGSDEEQTDGIVATEALEQLEKFAKSGENFFLGVGFFKPHTPYVAPKKYFEMYDINDIEIPEMSEDFLKTIPEPAAISLRHKGDGKGNQYNLSKSEAQEIKRAYYATVSFLDAQVGRIIKKLKDTGLDKMKKQQEFL
jgi:arylsulfatase A-like enzyme